MGVIVCATGCEKPAPPAPAKEEPPAATAAPSEKTEKTDPAAGAMFGKGRNQAPQVGTALLERIWVVRLGNNPFGGIQPCTMVVKGIYNAAQHTTFELDFVFNYRSGGNMISRRFTIPVKQMHFMMDHPTQKQFVRLDTVFDVSTAPVDPGTAVTGTVQLMHASNKQVRAAAGDSIPFSLNFSKDPAPAVK
ncbi:MAG TPA: hypothetical protein VFB62_02370 [Polyangiaceae bacterium]|nr:hypothetical protein [Polyangiaceae bacterium]